MRVVLGLSPGLVRLTGVVSICRWLVLLPSLAQELPPISVSVLSIGIAFIWMRESLLNFEIEAFRLLAVLLSI